MLHMKPPTTYTQQIEKLRSRGCAIADESFCARILASVNYYRLTAYFLPFRKPDGNYLPGTDFNTVYHLYEFDRHLRNLLVTAVEEVEIYMRAKIAYYHAHKYGETGYLDAANYNVKYNSAKFMKRFKKEVKNNGKALFVKHHLNSYGGRFPIWVATEVFTFGMLSCFYSDLTIQDQKQLARDMFGTIPKKLVSWLRCCTDLRNICAHYGRLYFRVFPAAPADVPGLPDGSKRRLFGIILALKALYPDAGKWNAEIHSRLKSLIVTHSNVIKLDHIGFPPGWETLLKK